MDGRSEVLLDVQMIQVAHTGERNTGVVPPQSFSAFNVFAEEQSLLSQNQSPGAADYFVRPGVAR